MTVQPILRSTPFASPTGRTSSKGSSTSALGPMVRVRWFLHSLVNAQNRVCGNLRPMSQISVADILELPVQERIHLVEVIWESIAAVPHAIEVSPELKTELEARLADFERNPEAGYSWDQAKAHLENGSWRTA